MEGRLSNCLVMILLNQLSAARKACRNANSAQAAPITPVNGNLKTLSLCLDRGPVTPSSLLDREREENIQS